MIALDKGKLTFEEVEQLISEVDVHNVFYSRHQYWGNYRTHFESLIDANQILTCRNEKGKLVGLCSWMIVDSDRRNDINKVTWAMPKNFGEGDILYLDVCILKDSNNIFKIRKFLRSRYQSKIKEVFWFNMPNGRVFRLIFKGGPR